MELNFATGLVDYTINGGRVIQYNPTDKLFIEKVFNVFDRLDDKQVLYNNKINVVKNNAEAFTLINEMNDDMKAMIDEVFGEGICDDIFKDSKGNAIDLYAVADGLPLWCNFLLAVIDTMDTAFTEEKKKTNPRIQKYIAKYSK